jgi:hypothetical protein
MLAVEAIMKALAKHLKENEDLWSSVGLIHDLDYEISDIHTHGLKTAKMLTNKLPKEAIEAIKKHNYENNGSPKPETKLEKALIAADAVSGLIVATALVMPNKKLSEVRLETLKKKFKQKDFARNVNRNNIMLCEKFGLSLENFLQISLSALQKISSELGL